MTRGTTVVKIRATWWFRTSQLLVSSASCPQVDDIGVMLILWLGMAASAIIFGFDFVPMTLCSLPNFFAFPLRSFPMASLIEGFFQFINPRQFVDDAPEVTTSSPRRDRSYLTLYDSYAGLGPVSPGRFWVPCTLRVYSPSQDLTDDVVHAHGRFSVVAAMEGNAPHLEIEVHRFVTMTNLDPNGNNPPDFRVSVTLFGRVSQRFDTVENTADKFFVLEVSDYIRDRTQTYTIRYVVLLFVR